MSGSWALSSWVKYLTCLTTTGDWLVLQVERVEYVLNVTKPADRVWLCQALVNLVKYLTLSVT